MRLRSNALLSFLIAASLRLLARTWKLQVADEAGLLGTDAGPKPPIIWVLWHNRLLVVPILYERFFRHRKGSVLISRSRDGGILADCIERFGGESVRGSSSRGGAAALRELQRRVLEGRDAYITPDGPKGPRYSVSAGAVWLAQATGAALLPVSVECSHFWRLRGWDRFIIPKPFAKVMITLRTPHRILPSPNGESLESQQNMLRELMMSYTELE